MIEAAHRKFRKSRAGRKPWDAGLFKCLILQQLYNFSDEEREFQLRDRLTLIHFVGLHPEDTTLDSLWDFRELLNVSIDSLEAARFEMITGHDKLQKSLEGLALAEALAIPQIKINSVLMRHLNDESLDDFFWAVPVPVFLLLNSQHFEAVFYRRFKQRQKIQNNG